MYTHDAQIKEEIEHYQHLLQTHRKRLHERELQAANYGIDVPPHISVEIENLNKQIFASEKKITELEQILKAQRSTSWTRRSGLRRSNRNLYAKLLAAFIAVVVLISIIIITRNLFLLNKAGNTSPTLLDPANFLDNYYNELNNRNYQRAFSMLSDNFKKENHCCKPDGSYDDTTYIGFWNTITRVETKDLNILRRSSDYVILTTTIHYTRTDGSEVYSDTEINLVLDKSSNQWLIDHVNTKRNY